MGYGLGMGIMGNETLMITNAPAGYGTSCPTTCTNPPVVDAGISPSPSLPGGYGAAPGYGSSSIPDPYAQPQGYGGYGAGMGGYGGGYGGY